MDIILYFVVLPGLNFFFESPRGPSLLRSFGATDGQGKNQGIPACALGFGGQASAQASNACLPAGRKLPGGADAESRARVAAMIVVDIEAV